MKDFNDKIVTITGAASGMGRAYAIEFARLGCRLALCDLDAKGLQETINLVQTISPKPNLQMIVNVAKDQEVANFALQVKSTLGDTNILINNAGIEGAAEPAWAISDKQLRNLMDINYFGVANCCREFFPQLQAVDEAVIVNVSSIFGLAGVPTQTDYCSSKFAVRGFTESLMAELKDSHILVVCLHPGGISTNIVKHAANQEFSQQKLTTPPEDIAKHLIRSIERKQQRVVYGNMALRTKIATQFLPLKWVVKLISAATPKELNIREYFNK